MLQVLAAHPVFAVLACCFLGVGIYYESQRWFLPMRIPATEIALIAGKLIQNFGSDAADNLAEERERAASRVTSFEEGKWWRVEREIRRR